MNWPALLSRTNAACLAVFGGDAVLNGRAVRGDFFDASDTVYLDGVSAEAARPQFVMQSHLVPAAVVGMLLVLAERSFRVMQSEPDGAGLTQLTLAVLL